MLTVLETPSTLITPYGAYPLCKHPVRGTMRINTHNCTTSTGANIVKTQGYDFSPNSIGHKCSTHTLEGRVWRETIWANWWLIISRKEIKSSIDYMSLRAILPPYTRRYIYISINVRTKIRFEWKRLARTVGMVNSPYKLFVYSDLQCP